MTPSSVQGQPGDDRFNRAIDIPDDQPLASSAGLELGSCACVVSCDVEYTYTIVVSPTLVEDAQAVLDGKADYLLHHDGLLADIVGFDSIDQGLAQAVVPQAIHIPVAPQANDPNVMPYGAPPQLQPSVPVALINPTFNNQVQHATVTTPQCPYGCAGTFGRPGEYNRHMKKHNGPFFPCTQPSCGMMFYRRDKLRDHLARGH